MSCCCVVVFWALTRLLIVAVPLCQIIGFFSPAWGCKYSNNATNNVTDCDIGPLFDRNGLLDEEVFYICLISMLSSVMIAVCYLCLCYKKGSCSDVFDSAIAKVFAVIFYILQFLAGIAFIICLVRINKLGWSAVLFFWIGILVLLAVVLAIVNAVDKLTKCFDPK